jgi:hypothetical protein
MHFLFTMRNITFYSCTFCLQDAKLEPIYSSRTLDGMLEVDVVLEAVDFLNLALLQNNRSKVESKEPTLSKKAEKHKRILY